MGDGDINCRLDIACATPEVLHHRTSSDRTARRCQDLSESYSGLDYLFGTYRLLIYYRGAENRACSEGKGSGTPDIGCILYLIVLHKFLFHRDFDFGQEAPG